MDGDQGIDFVTSFDVRIAAVLSVFMRKMFFFDFSVIKHTFFCNIAQINCTSYFYNCLAYTMLLL